MYNNYEDTYKDIYKIYKKQNTDSDSNPTYMCKVLPSVIIALLLC